MVRPTPLLIVAVLMAAGAYPAEGQEPLGSRTNVVTVRVPIGDLDLSQDAGANALLRRASHAASRACGGIPRVSVFLTVETRAYRECRANALSQAVAQLDSPLVNQRFAQGRDAQTVRLAQARP